MRIKNFLAVFLFLLFSVLPCCAQEYSRLYLVKNAQKENLDNFTQMFLREYKYNFSQNDGYLIKPLEEKNSASLSQVILIKQTGSDCYFYYLAGDDTNDISEKLLKRFKAGGLKTKRIKNAELLNVFHQDAMLVKSNTLMKTTRQSFSSKNNTPVKYDFSDEAQAAFDAQMSKYQGIKTKGRQTVSENKNVHPDSQSTQNSDSQKSKPQNIRITNPQITVPQVTETDVFNNTPSTLNGRVVHIPKGEQIIAVLQSAISSESVAKNDSISATLANDWRYSGVLIAPAGSILYGTATEAKKAGYAYGNGEIKITFKELLTQDGQRIQLPSNNVTLATGVNRGVKIAANVIGGAILGVASGALYTLISGGDIATGLAVGAGIGGAGGALTAATRKGQNVEIPSGTNFEIKFTEAMTVSPAYQ